MALHTQFHRQLDKLWHRRTAGLRALVQPRFGKPLAFTRTVRNRVINDLLEVATKLLVRRLARREFADVVERRRLRGLKGRGLIPRGRALVEWAEAHLSGPIVYAFWRGRRCLYVGKGQTWRRLAHYQKSAYLLQADSIEVFVVRSRSHLTKAECLATHMFQPRDLKVRPAKVKWGKKCPVCTRHDKLRRELRALFPMR